LFSGTARKSRFLAEFTLSDKQIPRFARNDKREGLGMTAPDPFFISLLYSFGTMTGSRRELVSKLRAGRAGGMPSSNTPADFKALIGFVLQFLALGAGLRPSRAFSPRLFPLPAWGGGWGGRDPEPGSKEHRVVSSMSVRSI